MSRPVVTVEVAFASDPMDPTPAWTDVTADWAAERPLSIRRGRSDELATIPPSEMRVTLEAHTGAYTPRPSNPNVLPLKRIRVRVAKPGGGTSYRYTGHVLGWPISWPYGGREMAHCEVVATDRLGCLTRDVLGSVVDETIEHSSPRAHWPMTETGGDSCGNVVASVPQGDLESVPGNIGSLTLGGATGPWTDSSPAAMFEPERALDPTAAWTPERGPYMTARLTSPIGGVAGLGSYSAAVAFSGTTSRVVDQATGTVLTDGPGWLFSVGTDSWGRWHGVEVTGPSMRLWSTTGGVAGAANIPGAWGDGAVHVLVWTMASDGSVTLWVDGVVRYQSGIIGRLNTDVLPLQRVCVGGHPDWRSVNTWRGGVSHVAIWDRVLSDVDRVQVEASLRNGYRWDTAGQRIARYLSWSDVDPAERAVDATGLPLGHIDTAGSSAAAAMSSAASTDGGRLYVDGLGRVVFRSRVRRLGNRPVVTISDPGLLGPDLEWTQDDQSTVNDVTVDFPGGGAHRVENAASVAAIGTYSAHVSLAAASSDLVLAHAEWLATRSAIPAPRIRRVTLDLLTLQDALVAQLLDLELGDTLRLTGLPDQSPETTTDLTVEGITESIGVDEWTMVLSTSPAAYVDALILDDATYGRLDQTYVLGDY